MKILLLGPQGAGKGTQAQQLARITGALHISTGDLVRAEIKAGTALGHTIKDYNDRGELVPDDIIVVMALPHLQHQSWILDGFPRNRAQATALDAALHRIGVSLDRVIALEAADADLLKRLCGRRQSVATGQIYHMVNNPPPASDPGPFVQRDDDKPEHIRRRLEIYHKETAPLKQYYRERDMLSEIDALGPIDRVTGSILRVLEERPAVVPIALLSRAGKNPSQAAGMSSPSLTVSRPAR